MGRAAKGKREKPAGGRRFLRKLGVVNTCWGGLLAFPTPESLSAPFWNPLVVTGGQSPFACSKTSVVKAPWAAHPCGFPSDAHLGPGSWREVLGFLRERCGWKNPAILGVVRVSNGGCATGVQDHDDFELVAAAQAGDLEAFGELVRRHQDFVYGAVLRVVKNPTLAEDVSQDCFLRAHRALADFRGDSQVRSWLYRIAHNLALNAVTRRREYPTEVMPEILAAGTAGPERSAELAELAAAMGEAIESLPDDLKQPLVLREVQHHSYEQIAEELDLPLNTVRTRIFRARRALQSHMRAWQ